MGDLFREQQAKISVVGFHAESFGFLDDFFGNVGDVHKNYMCVLTFAKKKHCCFTFAMVFHNMQPSVSRRGRPEFEFPARRRHVGHFPAKTPVDRQ